MGGDKIEMAVNLDTHSVESPVASEIYISATPKENKPLQKQAEEIFADIRDVLRSKNASIFQERVFSIKGATEVISQARAQMYGDIDDGVAPTFLVGQEGISGPIAGVQVYAVSSNNRPETISIEGTTCGRIIRVQGRAQLTLSNISAQQFTKPSEQARGMLEKAESALKQFGADFLSVARTWMWLSDILSWYDDFNQVRNQFFIERGAIKKGGQQSIPASTGVGLGPANGGKCAMDLTAVLEPPNSIQYLQAAGKQQSALEYGSAFSRACRATTLGAETVYVSGTASIDANGETTNIGDVTGQINTSIENVRAVLRDMNCRDEDVVQVVAYCKTAEVEKTFEGLKSDIPWPWVTAIGDICRPDLLFEIEAAAVLRT